MIKGFLPQIRTKSNSKRKRKEIEREAGKNKMDISSMAQLMTGDIVWKQMDEASFWRQDFFVI